MERFAAAAMLLLALPASMAACSGSISQLVPAVVGEEGGLVNVTVSLAPAAGGAYVAAYPRTAVSTQESVERAVAYAYAMSGKNACSVLVGFRPPDATGYVEGPSAGTALAVMTYALLEGRPMRQDAIMTGTIEEDGGIGEVGGLYEKSRGAARAGAAYFITPVESFYERLLLRNVEREYGMTVLEAHNASEVMAFMLDNVSIPQQGAGPGKRPMPDLPRYNASGIEGFMPVARRMIALERETAGKFAGSDNETAGMREYFLNEADRQERLLELGYQFSAANEAFLAYIDLSTIRAMAAGDPDLPGKRGEAGICLTGLRKPQMAGANFEWLVGSELREGWAYLKLNETDIEKPMVSDEEYVAYNELMYAHAWCSVARELAAAAPGGGNPVNESAWKALAEKKIAEAQELERGGGDTRFKMDAALAAYERGRYGAAIYDALYVMEMDRAAQEGGENAAEEAAQLLNGTRTSLWGRIYQSQGAFLQQQGDVKGAWRILRFAKSLDAATAEMREAASADAAGSGRPVNGAQQNATGPAGGTGNTEPAASWLPGGVAGTLATLAAGALSALLILIFLFLLVLILVRGSDPKGAGQASGTKQKKGRA